MSNARDKANIPALNFSSTGIDDNATSTALTIDSAEQVGIGTASPSQPLHVYSTGNDIARIETNQTEGRLSLKDATGEAILKFRNDFRFTNSGGELARLNSSGILGVGTSAPDEKIHVESSVATKVKAKTTTSTTLGGFEAWGNSTSYIKMYQFGSSFGGTTFGGVTGNNQAVIEAQEVSSLAFTTQGGTPDIIFAPARTARMTIKNGGNVGIGTSSPSRKLHVLSGVGTAQIQSTGASSTLYFADTNSSTIDNQGVGSSGNDIFIMANGTEKMRLTSGGNLGIATTSPSERLHVNGHIVGNSLNIPSNTSSPPSGTTIHQPASNVFAFRTDSTERMRLDNNSGTRLFIGTTSDVSHGMSENNRLIVSGYSGNGAGMIGFLDTSGNTDGTITVGDGIMTIGADTQNTTASSELRFRVDNTEHLAINTDGELKFTNTPPIKSFDFGSCSVTIANGSYIDFPSTSGVWILTETVGTGQTGVLASGGGASAVIGQTGSIYSNSSSSGSIRFFYNSGTSSYRLQNNYGITVAFGICHISTRAST